ncbi:MAG: hypothetical protein QMC83_08800, partial [Thermodesulfovibrionales bacterium]|nr:hypothetical protein [Thermodesulfovibrionales bacterium]
SLKGNKRMLRNVKSKDLTLFLLHIESSFSLVGSIMDRVRKWHDALMVHFPKMNFEGLTLNPTLHRVAV